MELSNLSPIFRSIKDVPDDILLKFYCGRNQLDEFLHEDARLYDEHALTKTIIVFLQDFEGVAAYFSLSADAVLLSDSEKFELGLTLPIKSFPAVKITKLAIVSSLQGRKIGSALIDLICGLVNIDHIAVRLLTVDAVNNPDIMRFYSRTGFLPSLRDEKAKQHCARETILMFKDLYASN